jgi:hypothetical protein
MNVSSSVCVPTLYRKELNELVSLCPRASCDTESGFDMRPAGLLAFAAGTVQVRL